MVKWFLRILVAVLVGAGGFWSYAEFTRVVPGLFWNSPSAISDGFALGGPLAPEEGPEVWDRPAYARAMARQYIQHFEYTHDEHALLLREITLGGVELDIPPFDLPRRFEPDATGDPRVEFAALMGCRPLLDMYEEYGTARPDWTRTGTRPDDLIAAAASGDLEAQYELGLGARYIMVSDPELASELEPWLYNAAEAGHLQAMAISGIIEVGRAVLDRAPLPSDHLAMLRTAADAGNLDAMMFDVLLPPRDGESLEAYGQRRLDFTLAAAQQCHIRALDRLAWRIASGRGVRQDHNFAVDLILQVRIGQSDREAFEAARLTNVRAP